MTSPTCIAVVAAAGAGRRCGAPKQFAPLGRQTVLWHALQPFIACAQVERIRVVVAADKHQQAQAAVDGCGGNVEVLSVGGETRAASVYNGLVGLADDAWVLVHDAARPCLSAGALVRLLAYMQDGGGAGAVLALPVDEALKTVTGRRLAAAVDRTGMWAMQTPQLFRAAKLRQALRQAPTAADDAEAVLQAGGTVEVVEGERQNIKITYAEDLQLAERLLAAGVLPPADA